jgi:hypothetical protein
MKKNVEKKHAEKTYPILSHTFNQMIVRPLGRTNVLLPGQTQAHVSSVKAITDDLKGLTSSEKWVGDP